MTMLLALPRSLGWRVRPPSVVSDVKSLCAFISYRVVVCSGHTICWKEISHAANAPRVSYLQFAGDVNGCAGSGRSTEFLPGIYAGCATCVWNCHSRWSRGFHGYVRRGGKTGASGDEARGS